MAVAPHYSSEVLMHASVIASLVCEVLIHEVNSGVLIHDSLGIPSLVCENIIDACQSNV